MENEKTNQKSPNTPDTQAQNDDTINGTVVDNQQIKTKTSFKKFRDWKVFYKIGGMFLILLILILLTFASTKYYQSIENKAAKIIIDVAGRNRMLSQKIAAIAEQIVRADAVEGEQSAAISALVQTIDLHDKSLYILKNGGLPPKIATNIELPPAPEIVMPVLEKVEELWAEYKKNAEIIIKAIKVREASRFIGDNYSKMLRSDDELVKAYVNSTELKKNVDSHTLGNIVNLAGRNRMLSQRIGLASQRIFRGHTEDRKILSDAIKLHHKSLIILKEGGVPPEMGSGEHLPPTPSSILPTLLKTEELWLEYKENAEVLLANTDIQRAITFIGDNYSEILDLDQALVQTYLKYIDKNKMEHETRLNSVLFIILFLNVLVVGIGVWIMWRFIIQPLGNVSNASEAISIGDLSQVITYKSDDEVGKVASSINKLIDNLKQAASFATNIGEGNFDSDFKPTSDRDGLGIALTNMRNKLINVAAEDNKRNWATKGLAKFGEILRSGNNDIEKISDEIVSSLVKYLNANQGSLFIVNNEDPDNPFLELNACYAWDKKKHYEDKIEIGQGLAGRAWQEGDTIYMTDVPDNYVNITSGIGNANPRSIIIVPLKINEEIFGIIEIASFKEYKDYEIEFIEKLSESIASTISSVRINEQTKNLLEESQQMTEELRAQEEEMRQNTEELQATQEELNRNTITLEKEIETKQKEIERLIKKIKIQHQ